MAASNSELQAHATSNTDFYALLGLKNTSPTKPELDTAWRKTALKYHPDKAGASNTAAHEKFHLASIAYDLLRDPELKQLYDNARKARDRRREQDELMEGTRRQMKQDLERRERSAADTSSGVKRARDDTEDKLQKEIDRIAADGKRRRLERKEKLRQQMEHEQEEVMKASRKQQEQYVEGNHELERSVIVKFLRAPQGEVLNDSTLEKMFSTFGNIEIFSMRKDKRERVDGSKHKTTLGRALILYKSLVGTYTAIEDWTKQKSLKGGAWLSVVDVSWAEGKEPDCLKTESVQEPSPLDDTVPRLPSFSFTPMKKAQTAQAAPGRSNLNELIKQRMQHDEERRRELENWEPDEAESCA